MWPAYTAEMKRLQIYLAEELDERLTHDARREGRSKAALIRDAIAARYPHSTDASPHEPLDDLVGAIEGPAGDIDALIYGGAAQPATT